MTPARFPCSMPGTGRRTAGCWPATSGITWGKGRAAGPGVLDPAALGGSMIIGTAGHIDHGKSTLVTALTGRPMDRLAEERRREITIELNFAPLDLGTGRVAGVVDVPGHEDFVRTMVAGASGIDLALLVIAADEGFMPQTEEHLPSWSSWASAGIPVITKADLVEPDWLQLVALESADGWPAHQSLSTNRWRSRPERGRDSRRSDGRSSARQRADPGPPRWLPDAD